MTDVYRVKKGGIKAKRKGREGNPLVFYKSHKSSECKGEKIKRLWLGVVNQKRWKRKKNNNGRSKIEILDNNNTGSVIKRALYYVGGVKEKRSGGKGVGGNGKKGKNKNHVITLALVKNCQYKKGGVRGENRGWSPF